MSEKCFPAGPLHLMLIAEELISHESVSTP